MGKVSVILPTFNERGNIRPIVDEILDVFRASGVEGEVVIVDDGSPDGTGDLALILSEGNFNLRVIANKKRIGLAPSIFEGIKSSSGDIVVVMDSDGSHPPSVIPRLIEGLGKADLCLASRYITGGEMEAPKYKHHLSRLLNLVLKFVLDLSVKDLTGGFFAVKKEVLSSVDVDKVFVGYGDYFFRMLYALKKEGKVFFEVPFRYGMRKYGKTKTNVFIMGLEYIYSALKIRLT